MIDAELLFFFNDTATTEIYTLSLHDALPISRTRASARRRRAPCRNGRRAPAAARGRRARGPPGASRCRSRDRKSTRLNSSHANISYAVFCLKKKTLKCEVTRACIIEYLRSNL